jgi:hypothetical protein
MGRTQNELNGIAEHRDGGAWKIALATSRAGHPQRLRAALTGTPWKIGDVIAAPCCGTALAINARIIDTLVTSGLPTQIQPACVDRIVEDHPHWRIIDREGNVAVAHYTPATSVFACAWHNGSNGKHEIVPERDALALARIDRFAPRA